MKKNYVRKCRYNKTISERSRKKLYCPLILMYYYINLVIQFYLFDWNKDMHLYFSKKETFNLFVLSEKYNISNTFFCKNWIFKYHPQVSIAILMWTNVSCTAILYATTGSALILRVATTASAGQAFPAIIVTSTSMNVCAVLARIMLRASMVSTCSNVYVNLVILVKLAR